MSLLEIVYFEARAVSLQVLHNNAAGECYLNPASTPVTMSTPSLGHMTLFVLFS